jgi:HEAT repeats
MLCSIKSTLFTLAIGSLGLTTLVQVELNLQLPLPKLPLISDSRPCGYPLTKSKVPCLIRGLQSSNNLIRRFSAWDLGELGEVSTEAVPYLSNVLKEDKGKWERLHACLALGKIGLPITMVLPSLRLALEDSDRDVRGCAATALGILAVKIQNKFEAGNLPQADLNIATSELEESLQLLEAPNTNFNREPIEKVTTSLDILRGQVK